jgi:hypothetical protein
VRTTLDSTTTDSLLGGDYDSEFPVAYDPEAVERVEEGEWLVGE